MDESNNQAAIMDEAILNSDSWSGLAKGTRLPWNTYGEYEESLYQNEKQLAQELIAVINITIIHC